MTDDDVIAEIDIRHRQTESVLHNESFIYADHLRIHADRAALITIVKRQNDLISATAAHWLESCRVIRNPPVPWEGAIDGAMEAACKEIAAGREREAALREALEDIARGDYSDPMCKLTPEGRARKAIGGSDV